jgi:hypothetical protein
MRSGEQITYLIETRSDRGAHVVQVYHGQEGQRVYVMYK